MNTWSQREFDRLTELDAAGVSDWFVNAGVRKIRAKRVVKAVQRPVGVRAEQPAPSAPVGEFVGMQGEFAVYRGVSL
jgi:hypothetical protein